MRGEIQALYLIFCGYPSCGADTSRLDSAYDKASAASEARRLGWKYTKNYGWICSDCVRERKQSKR